MPGLDFQHLVEVGENVLQHPVSILITVSYLWYFRCHAVHNNSRRGPAGVTGPRRKMRA